MRQQTDVSRQGFGDSLMKTYILLQTIHFLFRSRHFFLERSIQINQFAIYYIIIFVFVNE